MRHFLLSALLCTTTLTFAQNEELSSEERLQLRRISQYWREGDFQIAKVQIQDFLQKHPESAYSDPLYSMMGDLHFKEGDNEKAEECYAKIQDQILIKKVLFHRLQALFALKNYPLVVEQGAAFVKEEGHTRENAELIRFLLAESLYQEALSCKVDELKNDLLAQAKMHYRILSHTKYRAHCLFPLAEMHRILGEKTEAAALYLSLAENATELKDEYLFQAATLFLQDNKNESLSLFDKVYRMGKSKSQDAAYNKLSLLFEEKRFEEFLSFYNECKNYFSDEKIKLLPFYIGLSKYALKDYKGAVEALEIYLAKEPNHSQTRKDALCTLVNCAKELNERPLFDRCLSQMLSTFPKDPETAKALLMHAQICKERKDVKHALDDLFALMHHFPEYEQKEGIFYDISVLYMQDKKWNEARRTLKTFLNRFPESAKTQLAWRHLVNCSLEEVKESKDDERTRKEAYLLATLRSVLKEKMILDKEEKRDYRFLLIKTLYEAQKYDESLQEFTSYEQDYSDHPSLAEGYLVSALCRQKLSSDPYAFIADAEKALTFNPNLQEGPILHLYLFNAYINLGDASDNFRKAADHLFISLQAKKEPIQLENQVWLANFYYNEAKAGDAKALEKAEFALEVLLDWQDGSTALIVQREERLLENEILELVDLYSLEKRYTEKVELLEALADQYSASKKLNWKSQRQTLFELAKSYEHVGEVEKAIKGYDELIQTSTHVSSHISHAALLQKTRLTYANLPAEQKQDISPEMISIYNALKDLQIRKRPLSEPLYIEAALDYVEMRQELASTSSKAEKAITLLEKIRQDYSQDYLGLCKESPEKEQIVQSYLAYIHAEILRLEAAQARESGDKEMAYDFQVQALNKIEELLQASTLTPYLLERAEKCKEALKL